MLLVQLVQALVAIGLLSLSADAFHIKSAAGTRLLGSHTQLALRTTSPLSFPRISAGKRMRTQAALVDELESGPALNMNKRAVVDQFVRKMGGKRTIQRILIANNGMAATKSILSMRQWAYMVLGDEKALEFVVMATRDDLNANAEFIRLADTFVEVPSGSNKNNYANVDLIVSIAEKEKVDAVWPGWGHASENPRLPSSLKAKGIQFIGPTSSVMAALGDKVSANILAQTAKVPSIPWSGDGIECQLNAEGVIPKEVFDKACVFTAQQALEMAEKIGYPVMIKASEGGGGKGIRKAKNADELKTNFVQVQNEVPGSPIFMMQLCTNARHLEVQIVGDEYGNAVALNGRDCSTQRRFQKIFEEGPPIVAPKEIFREMELAAQRLTQSIGYIGAGTVEYLYNAATKQFYFLELNPRLQVEHPVTEGLTGTNLPSVQLQVAMGIPLDRIPDIRTFYGRDPSGSDRIDFMTDTYNYPKHHVLAARITAENPDEGFKPTSGRIERVKFQSTPRVWGYFSVGANGGIHEYADSQFGHLFATGATREEARKSLVLALKEIDVRGDIRTTVEYLIKLLETEAFINNSIDTAWLDGIIQEKTVSVQVDPQTVSLAAAVYKAYSTLNSQIQDFLTALSRGQTGLSPINGMLSFPIEIIYDNVKYVFQATVHGRNHVSLTLNGQVMDVKIREQPDKSLLCVINGESYQLYGQEEALGLRLKINGVTVMVPHVYNPSELRSDVTGKIVRFLHPDRSFVNKDEPYVEVEAMKMIMALKAPEAGIITHQLSPGAIISAGDLLASLQLQDLTKVKPVVKFTKTLTFLPTRQALSQTEARDLLTQAVTGYPVQVIPEAMNALLGSASTEEVCAEVHNLLKVFLELEKPFLPPATAATGPATPAAAGAASSASTAAAGSSKGGSATTGGASAGAEGSRAVLDESRVIVDLVKQATKDSALPSQNLLPVLIAHKQLPQRIKVVKELLRHLETLDASTLKTRAPELYQLLVLLGQQLFLDQRPMFGPLTLQIKQLLDAMDMPPFEARLSALRRDLLDSTGAPDQLSRQPHLAVSVDLLVLLMRETASKPEEEKRAQEVRFKAMEVFLRRVYRGHVLRDIEIREDSQGLHCAWTFTVRNDEDAEPILRKGYMVMLPAGVKAGGAKGLDLQAVLSQAERHLAPAGGKAEKRVGGNPVNVLHIGLPTPPADAGQLEKSLAPYRMQLQEMGVKMVNFLAPVSPAAPTASSSTAPTSSSNSKRVSYYNFYHDVNFTEDPVCRDMRPTLPQLLEIDKLERHYDLTRLPSVGRNSFLFLGREKNSLTKGGESPQTVFLRANAFSEDSVSPKGAERIIIAALDEMERALLHEQVHDTAETRLFVNVMPDIAMSLHDTVASFHTIMDKLISKYATRLLKLRVDEIEIKLRVLDDSTAPSSNGKKAFIPVRLIASSGTGGWLSRAAYREYTDPLTGQAHHYSPIVWHAPNKRYAVNSQEQVIDPNSPQQARLLQKKRALARKAGSTYAPDMLTLLEVAVINSWNDYYEHLGTPHQPLPDNLFSAQELVLSPKVSLTDLSAETMRRHEAERLSSSSSSDGSATVLKVNKAVSAAAPRRASSSAGAGGSSSSSSSSPAAGSTAPTNSPPIGMMAWEVTLKTPQYPEGRKVVILANDVTVQSGSFGVPEDIFFHHVSQYAHTQGLPKVYIACNSGARIGLVEEVKPRFKVQFQEAKDGGVPGLEYLYLTPEDYATLPPGTVEAEEIVHPTTGEKQMKLTAIIGSSTTTQAIGVENLRGSGWIAGETSRAYDQAFTLSYVTGRSVGIGAYLNRLGQRVIQKAQGPMILTGYSALNKLLGKEVYTSQDQLGGPQIMHPNGVSHQIVKDDQQGMSAVLKWLSYVPATAHDVAPLLPKHDQIDPVSRSIDFQLSKTPYDVRGMLAGVQQPDGTYVSGFCDKDSFTEYLAGWGKSVIAGRGRLGGINVGIIAVETKQVEQRIPADPGNSESREAIQPQAGQVWYPDSAFKTAQAINDFNKGENLPLIVFANWRGFSGGTRDMYGEILKYGAMIVDSLRNYKHPVFIYIPPYGELRGGAWVVIDPSINLHKIEMFADPNSRGGILEPPGICEVKYRTQEQIQTMHRLDSTLQELDEALALAMDPVERERLQQEIKTREKALGPVYLQIAHEFADLHDRAGRMKAKGCVDEVVEWSKAREFFYWRIQRRQVEEKVKEDLVALSRGKITLDQAHEQVRGVIPSHLRGDEAIVRWMHDHPNVFQALLKKAREL